MKKNILLICLLIYVSRIDLLQAQNSMPQVVSGSIYRIPHFQSKYVTARHVDVWLPSNYSEDKKYAVLYMHDGQMLYDSSTTWNKQAWDIDDIAAKLFEDQMVNEFIVVGIWNGDSTRHVDYFPQKPYEQLTAKEKLYIEKKLKSAGRIKNSFEPKSDNYLKFIAEELKPYIDSNFSVKSSKEHTFIAGSSMGGLISLYALCKYPEIFYGAACISTHWIGIFNSRNNPIPKAFISYLEQNLPDPKSHKVYMDCGNQTLDAYYPKIQKKVDCVMIQKGYDASNWKTMYFPGADHSEKSWKARLHNPLIFLFRGN